ncbi:DUF427 domain-containing protein [Streptomyces liangshanensis]|uniref:DUF427 domain-containing protein n=1 Tax=Streptomyces liangshanensis TaxID=2717324 RepID=A0A6G9H6I0_9ACTN|nr:DUF427 domain-containing protein [Streptomyces liangshanensis]QIQ06152.1 DUF427 domain-containing protein [Streptomyces liangshanensis]
MQAVLDGTVLADANDADVVSIEGNWYFPPEAITPQALSESDTPYTCPWKGKAQYFDARIPGNDHPDAAWSYPQPPASAVDRVGRDFTGYVAFGKDVTVA